MGMTWNPWRLRRVLRRQGQEIHRLSQEVGSAEARAAAVEGARKMALAKIERVQESRGGIVEFPDGDIWTVRPGERVIIGRDGSAVKTEA